MKFIAKTLFLFGMLLCFTQIVNAETHTIVRRQKPWKIPPSIEVRVVDEQSQPVAGMKVTFNLFPGFNETDGERLNAKVSAETDENGQAAIVLPPELDGKSFQMSSMTTPASGLYLPTRQDWSSATDPTADEIVVPDQVTLTVEEGKMVRFRVVDVKENGIPNVEIQQWPFRDEKVDLTDEDGYWEFGPVEKNYQNRRIHAMFRHPDYQTEVLNSRQDNFDPDRIMLQYGHELFGTVSDENGSPISDAVVAFRGSSYQLNHDIRTDENGRYRIQSLSPASFLMVVSLPGKVRHVASISPGEFEGKPLDVVLKDGKTLRVRLETEDGPPSCLFSLVLMPTEFGKYTYRDDLPRTTGDDTWEWNEAPDEEMEFRLQLETRSVPPGSGETPKHYQSEQTSFTFQPREEPYVIPVTEYEPRKIPEDEMPWPFYDDWKLPEKLRVTVLGEDGRPKRDAEVQLRLEFSDFINGDTVCAEKYSLDENGSVDFDLSQIDNREVRRVFVSAIAEGYSGEAKSWYSDVIRGDRKSGPPLPEQLEMLIYPEKKTFGLVRDDEGNPVEGAKVKLGKIWYGTLNGVFGDGHGRYSNRQDEMETLTDSNGIWSFDLYPDPAERGYFMYGISKEGYIPKSMAAPQHHFGYEHGRIVTLHRTKKVSGTVVDADGKPVRDMNVILPNGEIIMERSSVKTDEEGKFVLNAGTIVNGNKIELLLYGEGYSGIRKELDLTQETENLHFALEPGKQLKLRFVMDDAAEIPKMTASMVLYRQSSRGPTSFTSSKSFDDSRSGADGLLVLHDVPDAEMEYQFTSVDGKAKTEQPFYLLSPQEGEHVIKLIGNKSTTSGNVSYSSFRAGFGSVSYRD